MNRNITNRDVNLLNNPRLLAVYAVKRVLTKKQSFDDAIASLDLSQLEQRDRNFTFILAMSTLRNLGIFKELIARWVEKPIPAPHMEVELIIAVGLAQLYILKTPPHAAVNEMVEITKNRYPPYSGMVNAVLNKAGKDQKVYESVNSLLNIPKWLADSLIKSYGEKNAVEIIKTSQNESYIDITTVREGDVPEGERLANGTIRIKNSGNIKDLNGYEQGNWFVQDISASFPATLFSNIAGKTALDLCAAPGGKTAQLAAFGAIVTAIDISSNRLKRVEENLKRLKLSAQLIVADATKFEPDKKVGAILLDAPCSATGTLRRNPDVAWIKNTDDVKRLSNLQYSLLLKASDMLKQGGELVYSVCSLEKEEGEEQIERFLKEKSGFKLAFKDTPPSILPENSCEYGYRFLPTDLADKGGMDGFFMTKLVKI